VRGLSFAHCLGDLQEVERLLRQQWSPEQIAGRLKLEQQATVSHECIYGTSMLRKSAAAPCINICAVKRNSANGTAAICGGPNPQPHQH